jgi:hypothetical protein
VVAAVRGPALVARAEAGPSGHGQGLRRRLANEPTLRGAPAARDGVRRRRVNLATGIAMALYLARALLGLDVHLLRAVASLRNPIYDLFVLALAAVVLEPVKVALACC